MKLTELFRSKKTAKKSIERKFGDELEFAAREAFNTARTNISFVLPNKSGGKTIGITSANPQDGKSSVSINLSYALAKSGSTVLLIDADMRRPAISKYLKLRGLKGLSNILSTGMETEFYEDVLTSGMDICGAGLIPPNPSELLASDAMGEFITEMQERYDYIIVDLPPVLPVTDSLAVSKHLDGMILVVRHEVTRKRELSKAVQALKVSGVKILGFIYNAYKSGFGTYRSKKYGERYEYRSSEKSN